MSNNEVVKKLKFALPQIVAFIKTKNTENEFFLVRHKEGNVEII